MNVSVNIGNIQSLASKDIAYLAGLINQNNGECLLVGGCVRDALLGKQPHDLDICTDRTPDEIIAILEANGIAHYDPGLKHGTVTALINKEGYEITTYRSDGDYSDGRRPDKVYFEKNFAKDAARRDFTINAMGYDLSSGKLTDPTSGMKDLQAGIIRCVGDPDERFQEDSLRILRAMRFAVKYGFEIDKDTSDAMHRNKELLSNISKERITQEFEKMLTCGMPVKDIFMEYSDIISQVMPEIKPCIGFDQNNKWHRHDVYEHSLFVMDFCKSNDFGIKLAALLHDIGKPESYSVDSEGWGHFYGHPDKSLEISREVIAKRLSLDNETKSRVLTLIKDHDRLITPTDKSVRKYMSVNGKELLDDLLILKQADIEDHIVPEGRTPLSEQFKLSDVKEVAERLYKEEGRLTVKNLTVNGNLLHDRLGMEKSPIMGRVLGKLLEDVISGKLKNEEKALIRAAERYYGNIKLSMEREPVDVQFMIGIPGSGKSTIAENTGLKKICPDDVREKLYGDKSVQGNPQEVFGETRQQIRECLKKGQSFVYDATNASEKSRKNMCAYIKQTAEAYGYRVKINGVYVKAPLSVCIQRNTARNDRTEPVPEEVIERMYDMLTQTPPDEKDGFDSLSVVDNYNRLYQLDELINGMDEKTAGKKEHICHSRAKGGDEH